MKKYFVLFATFIFLISFIGINADSTPYTGDEPYPTYILFYLHNSTTGINVGSVKYINVLTTENDLLQQWKNTGSAIFGVHYDSVSFVIAPQFSSDVIINGTIYANIYMNQTGSSPTGGSTSVIVYSVSPQGSLTFLGSSSNPNSLIPVGSKPGGTPVKLTGPTINVSLPRGYSLMVNISISGTSSENYGIWWGLVENTYYQSTVSIPFGKYLKIENIWIKNSYGKNSTILPENVANKTIQIFANVSDPLGTYDFLSYPVEIKISNHTGSLIFKENMKILSQPYPWDFSAVYYTYFNYSSLPPGEYYITVNATDNTYHNLYGSYTSSFYGRNAFLNMTFNVGSPPVKIYVKVVDERNQYVSDSLVNIFSSNSLIASNVTNSSGIASFLLPANSSYNFKIYWENVSVGSFTKFVNKTALFIFNVSIIYPTLFFVTSSGIPVPYPLVSIVTPNGSLMPLKVADKNGSLYLSRVPAGVYTFTVIYDDSEIISAQKVLIMKDTVVINVTNVYPVYIKTLTNSGSNLKDVFVEISNSSTGAQVGAGITDKNGSIVFLLPRGNYTINSYFVSNYYLTPIKQNISREITVNNTKNITITFSSVYPPIYDTYLFFFLITIVILIAIFTFLLLKRK